MGNRILELNELLKIDIRFCFLQECFKRLNFFFLFLGEVQLEQKLRNHPNKISNFLKGKFIFNIQFHGAYIIRSVNSNLLEANSELNSINAGS